MQNENESKKMGRPMGVKNKKTIRREALRLLELAVLNEELPTELRAQAALQLLAGQSR